VRIALQTWIVGTAALIAAAQPAAAATWDDLLTGYALTSWTDDDGRALGSVNAIVQDADGYLWLGADAGLLRFDGSGFTAWDRLGAPAAPQAAVRSLWIARDSSLWAGFAQGAGVARIQRGRLTRYARGLEGVDAITELVEDAAGTIWAIGDRALFRLAGDQWARVTLPWKEREGQVLHPYVTRSGRLIVGTRWGVFAHDRASDRFDIISNEHVWGLGEDAGGRLWTTDIVSGFRPLGARAAPPHGVEGAGYRLMHDRQRQLWIATFGAGLWRVTRDGDRFVVRRAMMRSGLSSDSVVSIMEDRDGNVWVGTTGGLHRLTRRPLTPVDDIGLVLVTAPARDGGMWAGTSNGLIRLPLAVDRTERERVGASAPDIRALHTDDDGRLWIGANDGLWRLEGGRLSRIAVRERAQMLVRWLVPDRRGGFWIGDNDWLYRWDHTRLTPFATPGVDRTATRITFAGADASGRLWIGFANGRVGFVDERDTFQELSSSSGLAANTHRAIYSVFEDSGRAIWIGGSGGLSRFAGGRVATLTRANGLPADRVWAVVEDETRHLWLSMDRGIVRVERPEIERAMTEPGYQLRYQAYDTLDGVAGSAIGIINSLRGPDGSLWFVQGGGLTHADPKRLVTTPVAPLAPVQIASVVANETRHTAAANAALAPGTRRLEIQYAAPTLTAANKVRFRYRLDGVDTEWIDAATGRTALYTNLEPRSYRFQVQADVEGGGWNGSAAEWHFSIQPHFWETRWFYALVAAAALLAIWALWRARLRFVRRQFSLALAERARLSREIHDTLLQSLVGVALQVDVVSTGLGPSAASARDQLVRIRRQVEAYIRDARQSILDLRSPQLEQHTLPDALREFGRGAVADTGIRFVMTTDGITRECPPKIETQLLRIGQEAITNAVRHAHAARIKLELTCGVDSVTLRVSDDGSGFDYESSIASGRGHYGLRTMRERAEELGGELIVTTGAGAGTVVAAVVPATLVAPEDMLARL
jgi:signal transduction histidine kinase